MSSNDPSDGSPLAIIWYILIVVLTIYIFKSATWEAGTIYYSITTILGDHFPLPQILLIALYLPIAIVFWIGSKEEQETKGGENEGLFIIGFAGVPLLLLCWCAPQALAVHRSGEDELYSLEASAYVIGYVTFLPALLFVLIGAFSVFIKGVVLAGTRHPAEKAIERTVARRRPDYEIERELWRIMERQDATDIEIDRAFHQLSTVRQWALKLRYEKRAREARRMRELAQAKEQALREETGLAQSVHALERARRAEEDWYGKR